MQRLSGAVIDPENSGKVIEFRLAATRHRLRALRVHGESIPPSLVDPIARYIVHRRPLGPCLSAIAANDLRMTLHAAGEEVLETLRVIHGAFYWVAPNAAYGSWNKVRAWTE